MLAQILAACSGAIVRMTWGEEEEDEKLMISGKGCVIRRENLGALLLEADLGQSPKQRSM